MGEWILGELLDTYKKIKSEVAWPAKGKKRLRYSYLNERLDHVLAKCPGEKAREMGLSVERDDFGPVGVFGKKTLPAVILKGKDPRYKIFIDAEHGIEHAGPEVILRMIDEWQEGKFLPEVAGELEIYALPMFDTTFPNYNAYTNFYGSHKKHHSGAALGKKLEQYRDLFISIHQTPGLEELCIIAPAYNGPPMSDVAECAERAMEKWRTTYRIEKKCGQQHAYKKAGVPYLIFELNFMTYEQRVQAPDIGMDVLKETIKEFVNQNA